jgi:catechol 2,3-dioxygenase-like lactoylglutathione lyase family enzyme
MSASDRIGPVFWIDHCTIGTNDLPRWLAFHERILGAVTENPPPERTPDVLFQQVARSVQGGFLQRAAMPAPEPPGTAFPRYAYFVEHDAIATHIARLDAERVPHTDPARTASYGLDGTSVCFTDPDGNQFELWAPDEPPAGAMDDATCFGVGRISHVVYEARDLERATAFFARFAGLTPLRRDGIPDDVLVLPLAAGGQLVYRKVAQLGTRNSGRGIYRDLHTALVVREADFWPRYERLWAELPEWDFDQRVGPPPADPDALPARTTLHGSPAGRKWKAAVGRGDDWYDWDNNLFHYYVGIPEADGMVRYVGRPIDAYAGEYLRAHGTVPGEGSAGLRDLTRMSDGAVRARRPFSDSD